MLLAESKEGFGPYLVHHWYIAVAIPIIAGLIGWVTKLVAIEMMFRPLDYVGRRPFGWQGIVPSRAARMASIATEMMTQNLISAEDVLARLDPDRVVKEIEAPLHDAIEDITREVATEFQPGLWESMPEAARQLVIRRIQGEAPRMVKNIFQTIQSDVDAVFDIKDMVVTNLVRDKALLNRIFREAGSKEFRFIAHSGIYFGGSIGVLQMLLWAAFRQPLIMPAFGLGIGWFTDWLALKMIFNPRYPTKYFGFIEWQGLFLKRRHEVSAHYAALIASEIITPHKVIEAILTGPLSDKIFVMIQRNVQELMDRQTGLARPLVVIAVGSSNYQRLKKVIAEKVMARMPETMTHLEGYAADAMDIRNLLIEKMQELTPEEFEGLIRPAFQQDEWILITVGAVLGFTVGEIQALVLEHLK